jgi:hypothetical protein
LKALHIVSFDNPYPANYGGVIDVFYRIKALHEAGVKIHLHAFIYGDRKPNKEIENYCEKVDYYSRKSFAFSLKPYIVSSRSDKQLLANLLKDEHPILFEALHCCYFLDHPALAKRTKWVRMHNIEHDYYNLLSQSEAIGFKKLYLKIEALLLKPFEAILKHAQVIWAISPKDQTNLTMRYGNRVKLLPAFHANTQFSIKPEYGNFAFYHGKLSVGENHIAALFLVNEVMTHSSSRLIIAGDGAKETLKIAIQKNANIELKEGLTPTEIDALIQHANVNLLPTFQPTGIKLKLINCLFKGKHLLANEEMVKGTGLADAVHIANGGKEMAKELEKLMKAPFEEADLQNRIKIVGSQFDTLKNAQALFDLLN